MIVAHEWFESPSHDKDRPPLIGCKRCGQVKGLHSEECPSPRQLMKKRELIATYWCVKLRAGGWALNWGTVGRMYRAYYATREEAEHFQVARGGAKLVKVTTYAITKVPYEPLHYDEY